MNEGKAARVAVITGAGQGLGRAIAHAFSDAGFAVALIGRTASKLVETAATLLGPSLELVADLTDSAQVNAAFARIAEELGGIDVLINNAANYTPFAFGQATDAEIHDIVQQTLVAPLYCIRAAIPLMKARGAGDVISISSQSVQTPQPMMIVYSGAKAALEVVTEGLRNEYKGDPIRFMIVQIGVLSGTAISDDWAPHVEAYGRAIAKAGMENTFVYPGALPESIAASVVHAATAPRDIYLQTIEVRGTDLSAR